MSTTSVSSSTPSTTSTATSTSSSSSSATNPNSVAAQSAAASKAAAQSLMTSLGAGSGVDTASLAQNLVNAERIPQENAINAKISKNEARVSGYSAISYVMSQVQTAFTALKDQTSFSSITATSSNTSAFTVTTGAYATEGSHDVEVQQVARYQRSASNGFPSATTSLNGGVSMGLRLTVGTTVSPTITLAAGKDTPQDMVDAINAAKTGVTAKLVNTGDGSAAPYQIILSGPTGAAGTFSLAADYGTGSGSPGINFSSTNPNNQSACDAKVKVDGVTYTRSTNAINDIVAGVTFNLKGTAPAGSPASLDLTRDTTAIKDKINTLISSYNDAVSMLNVVSDPKSTVATYGATLVGDSTVRMVKQQLRSMFVNQSSTPGTGVGALWQMGISIDASGVMAADTTKLDTALTNNFDDVVKTFTGNQNNTSAYTVAPAGIAGDAIKSLTKLLSNTGPMLTQSANANTQNTKYQDDLTKLGTRMDSLLARYQKQFAAMDSLVGSVNSQKSSLKSTFDGMMASMTGKSG
jgi:flagellar hook-associated protein 2